MKHLLLIAILLSGTQAFAAPYTPTDANEVLITVAERANPTQLVRERTLQLKLKRDPENARLATELASLYLAEGQAQEDPLLYGRAKRVLAPWWDRQEVPSDIRLLRSAILRFEHRFAAALSDLDAYLRAHSTRADVFMSRAVLHSVMGNLDRAGEDCDSIARLHQETIHRLCAAHVAYSKGEFAAAETLLDALPSNAAAIVVWAKELRIAILLQTDRADEAKRLWLSIKDPQIPQTYVRSLLADYGLRRQKPEWSLEFLDGHHQHLPLLVRRAAALRASGASAPELATLRQQIAALLALEAKRQDAVHAREASLFHHFVTADKRAAKRYAEQNWRTQKEPIDRWLWEQTR